MFTGESSDEEDGFVKWKENIREKAASSFYKRQSTSASLRKLVYGEATKGEEKEESDSEELGGLFKIAKGYRKSSADDGLDTVKFEEKVSERDWSSEDVRSLIKDCFTTGQWKAHQDAATLLKMDEEDEVFGDFEDLETGEKVEVKEEEEKSEKKPEAVKKKDEMTAAEKRMEKKRKLKEMFDAEYDEQDGGNVFDDLKKQLEVQAQVQWCIIRFVHIEPLLKSNGYQNQRKNGVRCV